MNKELTIENATIYFKNFRGAVKEYNHLGKRTFCVRIDGRKANKLRKEGWVVKELHTGKQRLKKIWVIPVTIVDDHVKDDVNSKIYASVILPKGKRTNKQLFGRSIGILDMVGIPYGTITLRGYEWKLPDGRSGIKAYLKAGYFDLAEFIRTDKVLYLLENGCF